MTTIAEARTRAGGNAAVASAYAATYLAMRLTIGGSAVLLPFVLIAVDLWLDVSPRTTSTAVRTSMSAYYHSAARDFFVAGLCVIGVLLLTYLLGQGRRAGNLVSSTAGLALIVVALVPTSRTPGLEGALCGEPDPGLPGCTPIQDLLTESTALQVHQVAAAVFVGCLFALSVMFIRDEAQRLHWADGADDAIGWRRVSGYLRRGRNPMYVAGSAMIAAGFLVLLLRQPLTVYGVRFEPVYQSELLVFLGFALSWVVVGRQALHAIKAGVVED